MDRIRFLTVADVIAIHERAMMLSEQSPAALVRPEALESAVAQCKNVAWYMDGSLAELTVVLTTHIAMAHPWVDGNKRTASYAGVQFSGLNGAKDLGATDFIAFADMLLKYIEASQDVREDVFKQFVEFVDGWFAES